MLDKKMKSEIVRRYSPEPTNTGSAAVQIALLTRRIEMLNEHLKGFKRDHSSRRGLLKLVGRRRALLKYIKRTDSPAYEKIACDFDLK
ncbi:30S ribosomal protein S15 [Elusimicrobiota bacterium]